MFTVHPSVGNQVKIEGIKSLENYLPPAPSSPIKVFTNPKSQGTELSTGGYDAARLLPGPEGVVRTLREYQSHAIALKNG